MEALEQTESREQATDNVWAADFTRGAESRDIPIIDLNQFGLHRNFEGFITTEPDLIALRPGAEAAPYYDRENEVVYKLFDLRLKDQKATMGKRLYIPNSGGAGFEIMEEDGEWHDMLSKITILNNSGALITEISGISSCGFYIITKQPLAGNLPYLNTNLERLPFSGPLKEKFEADRQIAQDKIRAIDLRGGTGLRTHTTVSLVNNDFWLIGDLHERNIMLDSNNEPTIIDALIGKVKCTDRTKYRWLREACDDAALFRTTGIKPKRDPFEGISDDDL